MNKKKNIISAIIVLCLPVLVTGGFSYNWVQSTARWVPFPDAVLAADVIIRFVACLIACKLLYNAFEEKA